MCEKRYTVIESENGPLIKRVLHPSNFTGQLSGITDDQGRTGSEILLDERKADAKIEDERADRRT